MTKPRPMTKSETAEYLRVTERTLDRYRATGLIRAVKMRGKVVFCQEEVEAVLKKNVEKV
jgi:excisionase family DNA binding protein